MVQEVVWFPVSNWGGRSMPPKDLDRNTGPSAIPRKFPSKYWVLKICGRSSKKRNYPCSRVQVADRIILLRPTDYSSLKEKGYWNSMVLCVLFFCVFDFSYCGHKSRTRQHLVDCIPPLRTVMFYLCLSKSGSWSEFRNPRSRSWFISPPKSDRLFLGPLSSPLRNFVKICS